MIQKLPPIIKNSRTAVTKVVRAFKRWSLLNVDGGENPRIDGAVVSLEASFGFAETMMVRG